MDEPTEMHETGKRSTEVESAVDEMSTDWPGVRLISIITFLGAIQMFVIGMSEWPYMQQVDPEATSNFFGYVGSVSALGHAICAPLMGYWSSATGRAKWPLIVGRLIALVGCAIYICLELFPRNRRYVMLICYLIFGISMSSVSVMRGYIAKVSTSADRPKAVSLFGLATMFAVTIGPIFQLLFAPLSYPGIDIIKDKLRLNIYTGPIYVASVANIAGLILIIFFFHDKQPPPPPRVIKRGVLERKPSKAVRAITSDMRAFNLPLALSCIFIRMVAFLGLVTIHTTTSPLMMSVFGWSNTTTVKANSLVQAIVGLLSLTIFTGFATGKLLKFISEKCAALISLGLFTLFYLLTYPWPFAGREIPIRDVANNVTGCDSSVYTWCLTTLSTSPIIYLGTMVTVLGVAITLIIISTDSLYSKILGKIDQGTMQGVFLFAIDVVNICGPLIIAPIFTASGQRFLWLIDASFTIVAIICWLSVYKKLPKTKKP